MVIGKLSMYHEGIGACATDEDDDEDKNEEVSSDNSLFDDNNDDDDCDSWTNDMLTNNADIEIKADDAKTADID